MVEFLSNAFAAIPAAAGSLFGAVLFVVTIAAWLAVTLRVRRNGNLLNRVKQFPEKDRAKLVQAEMGGAFLSKGMSPEQYLRHQRQQYIFFGYLATLIAAVLFFGRVGSLAVQAEDTNAEAIDIGIPAPTPLGDMVALVQGRRNVSIVFLDNCTPADRDAMVDAGNHRGRDVKDFLERLNARLRPTVNYRVVVWGVTNERFEIDCS